MPRVTFTQNLKRHVECPTEFVEGKTVSEALDAVFVRNKQLRSYVLDDQGRLRPHMLIAVDGSVIEDRVRLSDTVHADSEIHVLQALSGG